MATILGNVKSKKRELDRLTIRFSKDPVIFVDFAILTFSQKSQLSETSLHIKIDRCLSATVRTAACLVISGLPTVIF